LYNISQYNLYVRMFSTYILPRGCGQQLFASARVGHSCWRISTGLNGGTLCARIARGTHACWTIVRILEASVIACGAGLAIHCRNEEVLIKKKDYLNARN
jgi:hypothetical protein